MTEVWTFIQTNWGMIATVLFALSEIIGGLPSVQASGVIEAGLNVLNALISKTVKESIDKATNTGIEQANEQAKTASDAQAALNKTAERMGRQP